VPPPASAELPFRDDGPGGAPESLVLDIGDQIGALILYADENCLGREIDLTPVGLPRSHHTHTMIRRRCAVDREFVAGVYPELPAGAYTVWGTDGAVIAEVVIAGGRVTEVDAGDCTGRRARP
jgi:hypothetical protein